MCQVSGAGRQRAGLVEDDGVDLLIVDRQLPDGEGLDLIARLRADGRRTPALVLSALGSLDDRVRGLRAGGDDYLAKPFALVELVARVEALLRRPNETRDTRLIVGPLDLDLLLYGDDIIASPTLTVPHPRMHERAFVLQPLLEIAPDIDIPGHGPACNFAALVAGQTIAKLA